ncbi:MAG: ribonuclease III [Betaproteobacteria bacterium]|nr:MAG: ribonuclease III [Betaproteobacteria bacterium]
MSNLDALQARLGYRFQEAKTLLDALTHRSFAASNNERLEFLGDGVLNLCIGLLLYQRFPQIKEGMLSRLRANLVSQQPLFEIATELHLGDWLRLGEGEMKSGGASRPSILADALESVLGATLLDGGFEAARGVIARLFETRLAAIDPEQQGKDAKTRLQEWLQSRRMGLPSYTLRATQGQAHAQVFVVECRIDPLGVLTEGTGASRKAAEQAAAEAACRVVKVS